MGVGAHVSVNAIPAHIASTAFYYHHARIMADMARLPDKKEDAETYAPLAEEIKQAFIKRIVNESSGKLLSQSPDSCKEGAVFADIFCNWYHLILEVL